MSHRSHAARKRRRAAHFTRVAAEQGLTLEQYNAKRAKEEDARWARWRAQLEDDERRRRAEVVAARSRLATGKWSVADFFLVTTDGAVDNLRAAWEYRVLYGSG